MALITPQGLAFILKFRTMVLGPVSDLDRTDLDQRRHRLIFVKCSLLPMENSDSSLIGRALNLYEGKNILTDMTLIGNGVPLNMTGGGVDLGHIGYGYTYTVFWSAVPLHDPGYGWC